MTFYLWTLQVFNFGRFSTRQASVPWKVCVCSGRWFHGFHDVIVAKEPPTRSEDTNSKKKKKNYIHRKKVCSVLAELSHFKVFQIACVSEIRSDFWNLSLRIFTKSNNFWPINNNKYWNNKTKQTCKTWSNLVNNFWKSGFVVSIGKWLLRMMLFTESYNNFRITFFTIFCKPTRTFTNFMTNQNA